MAQALSAEDGEITLTWSGTALDTARIESELVRLRRLAAGESPAGEGFAIRTSLLNMVVHADNRERARAAGQAIAGLAGHHPSRALIIITKPASAAPRIDARLAAHCHTTPGLEQQVCCEEVTLTVRGPAAGHLHSIIIPLLVPDLPVYVWWTGPLPRERHALQEMLETADHFIVDSARFASANGLLKLAQLCEANPGCSIGDLNWERLEPWREMLVRQCEGTSLRRYLPDVRDVKIAFASNRGAQASAQAFLLLGWLASRWGWDTAGAIRADGDAMSLPQDGGDISVEMRPRPYAGVEDGWLVSLSLRCPAGGGRDASISVSRIGDPLHLVVHVQEPEGSLEDHALTEPCDEPGMLLKQLVAPRHNPEYADALRLAVPLVEAARR
ncbi:MAG: glucose-6-phosphate dehydrogenase assembly protein OpcA [Dehalococcoidia bacterium]|nr:glucose-6-phosphate dehydrogenase assembly protein OpcA [Dehalococcoidia bacterium]